VTSGHGYEQDKLTSTCFSHCGHLPGKGGGKGGGNVTQFGIFECFILFVTIKNVTVLDPKMDNMAVKFVAR
jgi:hypothetical protein